MTIYTKTGDKGETSLRNGKRTSKASLRVESYGNVDELNSMIGLAIVQVKTSKTKLKSYKLILSDLMLVQDDLFELGASLADPAAKNLKELNKYLEKRITEFEQSIDKMDKKLPKITHFILPGGSAFASTLHLSRTFCRRAERKIVELSQKEKVDVEVIKYLNRLSDFFFQLARYANVLDNKKETYWIEKIK